MPVIRRAYRAGLIRAYQQAAPLPDSVHGSRPHGPRLPRQAHDRPSFRTARKKSHTPPEERMTRFGRLVPISNAKGNLDPRATVRLRRRMAVPGTGYDPLGKAPGATARKADLAPSPPPSSNTRLARTSLRFATAVTVAPGAWLASTNRRFSASLHFRARRRFRLRPQHPEFFCRSSDIRDRLRVLHCGHHGAQARSTGRAGAGFLHNRRQPARQEELGHDHLPSLGA